MTLDTPAPAPAVAQRLQRFDVELNHWCHIVPPGTDWREALSRQYWSRNFEKLRKGDRVEIHSSDHRIQFMMYVININAAADPVHFDAVFTPILPPGLDLPQLPPQ